MIAAYVDPQQPARLPEPEAEQITETELLDLMRKHCQKSWQATRWLLEIKFPERYGKRKAGAAAAPSVAQVLAAVSGVLAEEMDDDALRGRIEARLESLAEQKFVEKSAAAKPRKPHKPDEDAQAEALVKSSENPSANPAPPSSSRARSPEAEGPDLPQPAEVATRAESPSLQPESVATAPVVKADAVQPPLERPIDKPPPSPPVTWMGAARQQNEERKLQRKLRRQTRKKKRK